LLDEHPKGEEIKMGGEREAPFELLWIFGKEKKGEKGPKSAKTIHHLRTRGKKTIPAGIRYKPKPVLKKKKKTGR